MKVGAFAKFHLIRRTHIFAHAFGSPKRKLLARVKYKQKTTVDEAHDFQTSHNETLFR